MANAYTRGKSKDSLERDSFIEDPDNCPARRVLVQNPSSAPSNVLVVPADSGLSVLENISTSQFTVTASAGQTGISIIQIDAGKVYWSLSTGVTTSHAELSKGDILVLDNYAGSVFLLASSGTISVQVDKKIKT